MTLAKRYVLSLPKVIPLEVMANSKFGTRIEILYFLAFAYLRLLPNFGIYAGSGTAGMSMLLVAGLIMYQWMRKLPCVFYASIFFPMAIVGFIWFIVLGTHPEFWNSSSFFLISRLIWPAEAIIIGYLSRRPGFIKRLLLMMFVSTLIVMSFAQYSSDKTQRLNLATGGFLANSNDFASWTGFVALCLGMWAFNTRSYWGKIALLIATAVCIGLIALTVSRASMSLALGLLGLFVILQTFIFKPRVSTFLTLMAAAGVIGLLVLLVGIDSFISSYSSRANEDSGRERLWSLAVPIIQENPLGIGKVVIYDPARHHYIGPHNVFLYLGIIAGWIPMILTALYYVTCVIAMPKVKLYDGFLWIPGLVIYCILQHNQSNGYIFEPWTLIAFSLAILPLIPEQSDAPTTPPIEPPRVFYDRRPLAGLSYQANIIKTPDSA
jgi:hypothetical protein